MEDVLEVYHRQYRDNEILVCLDETSKQQVKETRLGRPPRPGAAGSYDYEYERNGVSNLFMLFAPLEGWRRVEVTERRTRLDWAEVVRKLVDEDYADRERIVLVMDNLNTHHPSSLYEAFEPAEARRIAERLEIHYTRYFPDQIDFPDHVPSWMARIILRHLNASIALRFAQLLHPHEVTTSLLSILSGIPQIKPTFLEIAPSGIRSNIIPHSKGVKCGLIRSNSPFSYSNHRPAKPKIPKPLVYAQVSPLGTSFATP